MTMGRRVAVLEGGVLQQCDTPRALYARPANVFVAGFIGSPAMNLHRVPVGEGGARLAEALVALEPGALEEARREGLGELTLGVRPESFEPATGGGGFAF